ncbi:hypothetical protein PUW25_25420 (plasmid) [Paenibacillus urinalis]|uniref:Uncharacterized protein n=1 Tax=Paenibacillus urinalis TaxID=521520 RepID=A0ABY7XH30_9BACL|nr:hypothetical protein [Paenibacillus urinalis]WDI05151.1 hypothetical protein PUW25_25420 [Paenibacillus urinalis]
MYVRGAVNVGKYIGKQVPSMFEKNTQRSINNLYTGFGLSRKGKAVALTGMGAYGGYQVINGQSEAGNRNAMDAMDDRGIMSLPGTRSDGMGYLGDPAGNQDLAARGDLVFALHNLRHGG